MSKMTTPWYSTLRQCCDKSTMADASPDDQTSGWGLWSTAMVVLLVSLTWVYIYIYICGLVPCSYPPNGMGPQVAPGPFYLQAIGSISEAQPRIC